MTNPNSAAQAAEKAIRAAITLLDGDLDHENAEAMRTLLSKLRAPVADERAALIALCALEADGKHADESAIEAWERARAALASAPVARNADELSEYERGFAAGWDQCVASAPVAEPRLEWSAKALYDAIKDVLLNHRLSNLVDEDGEFFPLVDHLRSQDDKTTESGEFEIALICDAIYNDVLTKSAPVAGEAQRPWGEIREDANGDLAIFTPNHNAKLATFSPGAAGEFVAGDVLYAAPQASTVAGEAHTALNEWFDKTDFIQKRIASGELPVKYLGWHRADVMRDLIDTAARNQVLPSGCIVVQEADTIPHTHPEYGSGIFFTEDAKIEFDAAPQASTPVADERVAEDTEVQRVKSIGPAYPYTPNTAPPTPLANAPIAGDAPSDAEVLKVYAETVAEYADGRGFEAGTVAFARSLLRRYAAPQASAENVRELPDAEMRTLIGNYFADDWAKEDAAGLLHDYARALKQTQADTDGDAVIPASGNVPGHLLDRLRHHAADKSNTAFSRSTMTEAAAVLADRQQRAAFDHPVFAFLLGEGPLHGVHFGDRHPSERGAYWWRKDLRAALSAPQAEQGERDA